MLCWSPKGPKCTYRQKRGRTDTGASYASARPRCLHAVRFRLPACRDMGLDVDLGVGVGGPRQRFRCTYARMRAHACACTRDHVAGRVRLGTRMNMARRCKPKEKKGKKDKKDKKDKPDKKDKAWPASSSHGHLRVGIREVKNHTHKGILLFLGYVAPPPKVTIFFLCGLGSGVFS